MANLNPVLWVLKSTLNFWHFVIHLPLTNPHFFGITLHVVSLNGVSLALLSVPRNFGSRVTLVVLTLPPFRGLVCTGLCRLKNSPLHRLSQCSPALPWCCLTCSAITRPAVLTNTAVACGGCHLMDEFVSRVFSHLIMVFVCRWLRCLRHLLFSFLHAQL